MDKVIVITGPTATGKTALGIMLAKQLGGEIVSADSMQVYKHMDIGTAKPTIEERQKIPHHMIDVVMPFEEYSVSRYVEVAVPVVNDIISRGKVPIIVGGTGLYIESLIAGRLFAPEDKAQLREELSEEYDKIGGVQMLDELRKYDPDSAAVLHPNDKKRVVRAVEIYRLTGHTMSEHNEESKAVPPRYDAFRIALDYSDREHLYDRINRRVDDMLEQGFFAEAKILLKMGLTKRHTAMQAIGYKEMMETALGEMWMDDGVESIKKRSRQYAKRQLTWLRRREDVRWISWDKTPDFEWGLYISTKYLENAGYI